MKSKWLSAILSAFAVIASASSAVAEAPCKYGQIAEVPVTMRGLRPMVSAKLNGVDVQFIVDSGAFYSILSVGAADRLKVPPVPGASLAISGMGGLERASVGRVKEFVFAGLPLNGVQFLILPNDFGVGVGLLGQNVLGIADVEYDLANGVIRLLKPQGDCSKLDLAYWATGRASVIPLQRTEGLSQHTIVSAKVNGREIRALFDTGATTSYLTRGAAQSGGVKLEGAEVAAAGVSGGVGAGLVETTLVPVDSFSIGGETIKNTRLRIASTNISDADMLVGADFFLSHRVLVSKSQRRLYFTYNGGPVFRLDGARDVSAAQKVANDASNPATGNADPADLARRAGAMSARGDNAGATALLDAAVALRPDDASMRLQRARARAAAKDVAGAEADLAKLLELKPNDPEALLGRGMLRLTASPAAAQADLDAAMRAAPDDPQIMLAAAGAYTAAGLYDPSVAAYDRWMAGHPQAERSWTFLNARCFSRALWGRELDKALADCDAALKRGGRSSVVLNSRGLVNLRQGRLKEAVADYDAALRMQPNLAWSLYGRGLARKALGDAVAGETDIRAALALKPETAELAARAGLAPAVQQ